ncbi:MAG: PSD1 and planctomycete cytochrome C domain-containing protein [Acidobacteriota bacterium]
MTLVFLLAALPRPVVATDQTEFFEKKIRPLLAEKCYACHSAQSPKLMAGLRVDNLEGLLKGGDSGPAIVFGKPEQSLLIKAVSYRDLNLRMPPSGKLSEDEIRAFEEWVRLGAPDPRSNPVVSSTAGKRQEIDSDAARQFWAFRPIGYPKLPSVRNGDWVKSPVDTFILAALEEKGLRPASRTDRRSLLRRATFDLTGLPPTPREIQDFLEDRSPRAFEQVVDRLLASPHYGERWARHWLDLVRFAETNGHEFDNEKLDAWRYRDYVIRAFNRDLPYDQFVREHIAGDLSARRISPDGAHWESPIATSFFWFGEVLNSATDSVKSRADEVDNQIDVLGKALLALTVACARCHDHKFDPIPTADYYALAGVMHSTALTETVVDSPATVAQFASLRQRISEVNGTLRAELLAAGKLMASQLPRYLMAAGRTLSCNPADLCQPDSGIEGLDQRMRQAWTQRLKEAIQDPADPFYPFAGILATDPAQSFSDRLQRVRHELSQLSAASKPTHPSRQEHGEFVFEDFESLGYPHWTVAGQAFGATSQHEVALGQSLIGYQGQGLANSFGGNSGSDRLMGSLTSEVFRMPKLYLHVRMAGSQEEGKAETAGLRVTVVADGHKSQHLRPNGSGRLSWHTVRLTKEIGRLCYIEIVDRRQDGHLVVDEIVLSDSPTPPRASVGPFPAVQDLLSGSHNRSPEDLAQAYRTWIRSALQSSDDWPGGVGGLGILSPSGKAEDLAGLLEPDAVSRIDELRKRKNRLESELPVSTFAMASQDQDAKDVRLHIRGSHKNLGEKVPRGCLQIVAGSDQPPTSHGSGRLQLAEWVASEKNPLTARVMVNRVWKFHFGEGLVRSVDNFGETGDRPSHPDLLDYLARRFIESGWSLKAMHRLLMLSNTYAMSSEPSEEGKRLDAQNRLWHHVPVRRLEAEVIRDSILAVTGRLDRTLYGPSVMPHISPYQEGRGKPSSGPLDGEGRRSLYLQVRRNFLTPMFLAFDYPLPASTIGRRTSSTVPSQALLMMNNEFVAGQARRWAEALCTRSEASEARLERIFVTAFGRPPEKWEVGEALHFLESQQHEYRALAHQQDEAWREAWTDLCHVVLNSTEFLYVR